MKRVGLYGGSFNPVHFGHLLVAQAALEELGLDRVVFIPAATSPFKPDRALAPGSARLQMLRLALAGRAFCEVDDQELRRGGISYSIDTVRDYAERMAGAKLFYLVGSDQAPLLSAWRQADELAKLVEIAIIPRRGLLPAPAPFQSVALRGVPFEVSASEIRARVHDDLPIDLMTPSSVAQAIRNNHLYL